MEIQEFNISSTSSIYLYFFTISALLGIDATKFSNSESGNEFYISDSSLNRCNIDLGCA